MNDSELIDVLIEARETVTYHQVVKMPRAKFDEINSGLYSDDRDEVTSAEEKAFDFIERDIVTDWEDSIIEEFKIFTAE